MHLKKLSNSIIVKDLKLKEKILKFLLVFNMPRIKENVRKQIVHNYCTETGLSYRMLSKRYGVSVTSVKNIIIKFGEYGTVADMPKSGRKKGPQDLKLEEKVLKALNTYKSISVRDLAKKTGTNVAMIQRIKKRNNLKTFKKQKIPKKSQKQKIVGKSRTRKLYERINKENIKCIVMDDETYVKLDSRTLPGPQFYTVMKGSVVDESIRTVEIQKFGEKALIWQAICTCGLKSSSFFTKGTINAAVYRKECLKKRLIPFYKKHEVSTLFWPDLATSHYAKDTLNLLKDNNIKFVEKNENPPNAPELRPIERYWAIAKKNLIKDGKVANDMQGFKKNWNRATKKIQKRTVQNLMKKVKQKLRQKIRE